MGPRPALRSGRLPGVPVFARLMGLMGLVCALGSAARLRGAARRAAGAAADGGGGGAPGRTASGVLPAAGRDQGCTAAVRVAAGTRAAAVTAAPLVAGTPLAVA